VGDNKDLERNLSNIVQQIAQLNQQGHRIIIVSSGAIGYGKSRIPTKNRLTMPQKQAAAAIGQPVLMAVYDRLFSEFNITTAQVLLTSDDFSNRSRYLALKDTLDCLLTNKVVPIVNENDCIAIDEMLDESSAEPSFGDNDRLSALLAVNLQADLLILLTNVDGIFSSNPVKDPQAKIISVVNDLARLSDIDTTGTSALGRGGMHSKIVASRIAAIGGTPTVIANGTKPDIIKQIVSNTVFNGTLISAQENALQARKKLDWICKWL
jgi:glutamate 5-kinase